jgi:endonuclease YncB( thermonuclease family)
MRSPLRLIFPAIACYFLFPLASSFPLQAAPPAERRVITVFDGDTIVIFPFEKVRLIGIDSLEIHDGDKLTRQAKTYQLKEMEIKKQGKKSKKIVEKLLKEKRVRLVPGREAKDSYGRTLAYVYFTMREDKLLKIVGQKFTGPGEPLEKEFMLNRVMVEYGWAEVMRHFPFDYLQEFSALEAVAKRNRWGMWKKLIRSEGL